MTSGRRMKYFSFCRVAMASTPPSKRNASGPSFSAGGEEISDEATRISPPGGSRAGSERLTGPGIRLVTGPGDLSCLLHLVARLVAGRPVSAQRDHTAGETGQVTHLVLQKAPFPFGDVGEAAARLPHQVGFYRLKVQKGKEKRRRHKRSFNYSSLESLHFFSHYGDGSSQALNFNRPFHPHTQHF